ncbi:MAG: hypothetical protein SFV15_22695 [Polyangiaceae bacterium]|nr:hypothetical protein [Polyangiaceae bacterium]
MTKKSKSNPSETPTAEQLDWVALTRNLEELHGGGERAIPTWSPPPAEPVPGQEPREAAAVRPSGTIPLTGLGLAAAFIGCASLFLRQTAPWDPRVERHRRHNGKFRRWW